MSCSFAGHPHCYGPPESSETTCIQVRRIFVETPVASLDGALGDNVLVLDADNNSFKTYNLTGRNYTNLGYLYGKLRV